MVKHPLNTVGQFLKDCEMTRLFFQDIRYYHACGYFDGRRPTNYRRLKAFSIQSAKTHIS